MLFPIPLFAALSALFLPGMAVLITSNTTTQFIMNNDRLKVTVDKSNGQMSKVILDGQDLTGAGKGPYIDCTCTPDGFWAPGAGTKKTLRLVKDIDTSGVAYAGVIMGDTYVASNQTMEQFWFLRDGETGLHVFTRVTYHNASRPMLTELTELRTLFRPTTTMWSHLYAAEDNTAPKPEKTQTAYPVAQDATWYLGNITTEKFVQQSSNFFTKYSFHDQWRNHKVHGIYADGSASNDTYGAWVVHNTVDTYYGGPLHSDIMVDGILYNYLVSGHHGNFRPNLTTGFERTFGPSYYHFNKNGSMNALAADAAQYADPNWNAAFYDSIAKYVPNYTPSNERVTFSSSIQLPAGATNAIAILSENGHDFQMNVQNTSSRQYWAEIDETTGKFSIPRVKVGVYRVTVYADGIFGQFTHDDIPVSSTARAVSFKWTPESAGVEIWRIGTPDKSAGEYRHGNAPVADKTLHPPQYRAYWGQYYFPDDFPNGVDFKVGTSDVATDLNYIHWSRISHKGNYFHTQEADYTTNVSNWTIRFDLTAAQLLNVTTATFTVQLAAAKTGTNTVWRDLPYTMALNSKDVETWIIPAFRSTSCGVREAVSCHNFGYKFVFRISRYLKVGENVMVLSLPVEAKSNETAVLPETTYVQYDALRLEFR